MTNLIVENKQGVMTNSKIVSFEFKKNEMTIIELIEALEMVLDESSEQFFIKIDEANYDITYKGFKLLTKGFKGQKAAETKLKFINAFMG